MAFLATRNRERNAGRLTLIGASDDLPLFLATAVVIVAAVVLGGSGGTALWSDGVVQVASLGLLALLAFRGRFSALPGAVAVLLAALLLVPLLQLIPLPPSIWTRLPGREQFAATYEQLGLALPYLPLSLNPQATWLSILSLLPAVAVFLATVSLGYRARRNISIIFLAFGVVSMLLGLAQVMAGPDSALRFYYPQTNIDYSVGFFANRNHHGAFLYSLVPLVSAWTTAFLFERRGNRTYGLAACLLVYVALILGFGMAGSRAALFLGLGATVASLLVAASNGRRLSGRNLAVIAGATVIGLVLVIQFAFFSILGRLDDGVVDAFRLRMASTTITAIHAFQPIGSGLGTFVDLYKMFELPQDLMGLSVNHAHNDWLELWLEGGWPFIALAVAFLIWFVFATLRVWREPAPDGRVLDRALAQGAGVTIVLLMVHSLVDYPLRTTTLMTLFAFCAALLVKPPHSAERDASPDPDDGERVQRQKSRRHGTSPGRRPSFQA